MVELWSLYELIIGFIRTDEDGVVIVNNVEVGIRCMRFGHPEIGVRKNYSICRLGPQERSECWDGAFLSIDFVCVSCGCICELVNEGWNSTSSGCMVWGFRKPNPTCRS